MKAVCLVLVWLCSAAPPLLAQPVLPDSAAVEPEKKRAAKPVFNFDTRYSFIDDETVRISGVKFGVEWRQKVRTGFGLYLLSTTLTQQLAPLPGTTDPVTANLRFGYIAGFGEYIIFQNKKWELSTPNQVGLGNLHYDFKDSNGNLQRTHRQRILVLEPSVTGHYKFFYWLGLGAGAGYRQIVNPEHRLAHDLNAPIYYAKVKLFVGELYRELIRKK